MINIGNFDINEEMFNLFVFEEVSEGIILMLFVYEVGNEDNMFELEEINEDLVFVFNEEYVFLLLMIVKKNKDMKLMNLFFIEFY